MSVNYLDFLVWHGECNELSGALTDEIAGLNLTEQNGVGSVLDGKFLRARNAPALVDGFARTVGIGEPFDLTSQGVDKVTMDCWARTLTISTDQVIACQVGATEQEKAWFWRNAHDLGAGDIVPLIGFRDNAGADYDWAFGIPNAGIGAGNYPLNEWCYYGWSASISDDRTSAWWYTQSIGLFYESFTGAAAFGAPFNYTTRGTFHIGDHQTAPSSGGGARADYDNFNIYHGIEFQQDDANFFWNGGEGRFWPNGYSSGGGGARQYYYDRRRRA